MQEMTFRLLTLAAFFRPFPSRRESVGSCNDTVNKAALGKHERLQFV